MNRERTQEGELKGVGKQHGKNMDKTQRARDRQQGDVSDPCRTDPASVEIHDAGGYCILRRRWALGVVVGVQSLLCF